MNWNLTFQFNIIESAEKFMEYGALVYLYNGTFQNSYYLTENISIMSLFNHHIEKGTVPALKVRNGGSLYKFVCNDLIEIEKNSIMFIREETNEG